jgi:hypothetical protein
MSDASAGSKALATLFLTEGSSELGFTHRFALLQHGLLDGVDTDALDILGHAFEFADGRSKIEMCREICEFAAQEQPDFAFRRQFK